MKIQVLIDNPSSWMFDFKDNLEIILSEEGHNVLVIDSHKKISSGDVLLLLSCEEKLVDFDLNTHNLVIHASDLPIGKGWSPLTWQVLNGANSIPVVIFEADHKIDNGPIYNKINVSLDGTELVDELRVKIFEAIKNLIINFMRMYPNNKGIEQKGKSTFYKKRTKEDSKLDINESLISQFNQLRVVDNERYPAYFIYNDKKYIIKVYSDKNE